MWVTPLWQWEGNISFPAVDANLITDKLTIRIASIDGIAAENAAKQKKISIMPEVEWETMLQKNPVIKSNIEKARLRQEANELRKQADEHFKKGNFSDVISIYFKLSAIHGIINRYQQGRAYFELGYYDFAIHSYDSAFNNNPDYDAEVYNGRGNAYFKLKKYDKAIWDYSEAIRLNPNFASAYFNRGCAYYSKLDYEQAISDYEVALRINPNNITYKEWLENARRQRKR